jgi:hypothetical protein
MERISPSLLGLSLTSAIALFAHATLCHAGISDLRCESESKLCWIAVAGAITAQDALAAARIPGQIPKGTRVLFASLESPGGDVDAAISIGRVLRSLQVHAQVGPDRSCVSACVLLLAGATTRSIATKGRVGIHRLYTTSTSAKDYDSLQRAYRQIDAKVKAYLSDINVPESLYEAMMQYSPEKVHFLSKSELATYHLSMTDQVAEDLANSRAAARYGLSKPEYLRRSAQVTQQCDRHLEEFNRSLNNDLVIRYSECRESILRGSK